MRCHTIFHVVVQRAADYRRSIEDIEINMLKAADRNECKSIDFPAIRAGMNIVDYSLSNIHMQYDCMYRCIVILQGYRGWTKPDIYTRMHFKAEYNQVVSPTMTNVDKLLLCGENTDLPYIIPNAFKKRQLVKERSCSR